MLIDTVHQCRACAVCAACIHQQYALYWRVGFAFCLPANCTSTLLCLSCAHWSLSSVNICGHRILLDKSGEDRGNGQKLPSKWSSLELLPAPLLGYSVFEHTRPAGLGMRTAVNADKINI
jgi:hypothetical protein